MSLPVVDLRLLGEPGGRRALQQAVLEGLTGPGFLYLDGVEGYDPKELLVLTKWFFSLPLENRMKITKKMFAPTSNYTYRGYFPVQPGQQSHKEGFEMGSYIDGPGKTPFEWSQFFFEDNQWPQDPAGCPPFATKFRESMERQYCVFSAAGVELLRLVAGAWGAQQDLFTPMFHPHHLSTFRLLHYPSRGTDLPACALKDDIVLQCDEHQDSGFVTMLETFTYGGLQREANGVWIDVTSRPGALTVNLGLLLSRLTGGVVKATKHRVLDLGVDRFSVPFFLEPSFGSNVNVVLPSPRPQRPLTVSRPTNSVSSASSEIGAKNDNEDGSAHDKPVKLVPSGPVLPYGRWLLRNLVGYIEYESLKQYL